MLRPEGSHRMPVPIRSGPYKTFRPLLQHETFLEYEGSTITVPLNADIVTDWDAAGRPEPIERKTEEIKLHAFMRLEVYPAYLNGLGTREFQFTIRDWDLFGFSPLLNELFYGDRLGRPEADHEPRRQAVMTFSLSNH